MPSTSSSSALPSDDNAVVKWVETVANKEAKCSSIIIMVARDETVRQGTKDYLKAELKKKNYSGLLVTTLVELQTTINKIKQNGKLGALILLFGAGILGAKFDVPGIFPELQVHCGAPNSAKQRFVIDGTSKYHEVRLDKWEARRHKNHVLKLGFKRGVVIGLEDMTSLSNPDWCKARHNLNGDERTELDKGFEQVRRHNNDWGAVKGYVEAIFGLLVGTTKFVAGITATADGLYAKYAFGRHAAELGLAGAEETHIKTAAGPAVELDVAASAAVYFIPYADVFSWLKGAVWWMWEKVKDIWNTFTNLLKRLFGIEKSSEKERSDAHHEKMPVLF